LLTGQLVTIDGSTFKSAASKDSVTRRSQLTEQRQHIEQQIDRFLQQLDRADDKAPTVQLDPAAVQKR